ncbi:MAG: hypothetical protein ACTHMS_20260 [Jatrophihabitans sp.]|uniref:hypothetical protein n=1 Tax=Jatrophihabitans sp. TaxID=1932789 RepID=UPI003F81A779
MMKRRIPALTAVAGLLAIAGSLVGQTAAGAATSSNVSFVPTSAVAGAQAAWTVSFTTGVAVSKASTINVAFDANFALSASSTATLGSALTTAGCTTQSVSVNGSQIAVALGGNSCSVAAGSAVSLAVSAVTNPTTATTYSASGFTVRITGSGQAPSDAAVAPSATAVTVVAGPASKLAFAPAPSPTTQAGIAFATQPVVKIQDSYGNAVTTSTASITLAASPAGSGLSCTSGLTVGAVSGAATFTGCSMTGVGTFAVTASSASVTAATTSVAVSAGAAAKLAIVQAPPADTYVATTVSPFITVQLQDANGNAVQTSGVTVNLAASSGTITGGSARTNASGLATFSSLKFASTVLGTSVTASSGSYTPATSGAFNVVAQASKAAGSVALTDAAADSTSGVAQVQYFLCPGYSNSTPCTGSNGTAIGTSTTGTGSYPLAWNPSAISTGAYRIAAIATDAAGNIGSPSSTIPVAVTA